MANNIVQDINDATNILLHTYMNLGIDTFNTGINSTLSKLNNVVNPASSSSQDSPASPASQDSPTSPASLASPASPASPGSPSSPTSPASGTRVASETRVASGTRVASETRVASGTSNQQPNDPCDSISMDQLFINYINSV